MDDFYVYFLYSVGVFAFRSTDFNITHISQFTAVGTGQGNNFHSIASGCKGCIDNIFRFAACADSQQNIAFTTHAFDIP